MKHIALIALLAPKAAFAVPAFEDHRDCVALINDAYRISEALNEHARAIESSKNAGNMASTYKSQDDAARALRKYIDDLAGECAKLR